jgi:hypothetical protein
MFGAPTKVLIDQNVEFHWEFQKLCQKALINHWMISQDCPKANRLVK